MEEDSKGTPLGNVIRIDDERVREHLGRVVRGTVEETLNAMLEAEADRLCNAGRYERTEARRDQRSGSYDRKLQTQADEVRLKIPAAPGDFETAIIERYRRRESRWRKRYRDVLGRRGPPRRGHHQRCGARGRPSTASNLNKGIYSQIEAGGTSRSRANSLLFDGIVLKRS